jgi:hypothetical protein
MDTPVIDGPRACAEAELPEVVAVVDSALRQGSDQSMGTDYPLVFRAGNLDNIRIIKVDGEVAAEVPFIVWEARVEDAEISLGYISPTATAAKHRRKGYGLLCLMDCVKRMNQLGCDLSILSTRIETFPFYECGGYQAVQKQGWLYACTQADAERFADNGEEIVRYDPATREHLAAIQAMHERDTPGVRRTAEAYASVFNLPKMKTLVALRAGRPAGYAIVSRASNKPGLVEAGGDEPAVESLVHRTLSELGTDPIRTYAHLTSTSLSRVLDRNLPGRREMTPQNHMVRINDAGRFFGRISRWLEKRNQGRTRAFSIGVGGETVSFRFSKAGLRLGSEKFPEHVVLSPRELVSVVFGPNPVRPVEPPAVMAGLFPFYLPIEMLDRS